MKIPVQIGYAQKKKGSKPKIRREGHDIEMNNSSHSTNTHGRKEFPSKVNNSRFKLNSYIILSAFF
jgi:hypothetical protein